MFSIYLITILHLAGESFPILQCPPTMNEVADMFDGQRQYKIIMYPNATVSDSSGGPESIRVSYDPEPGERFYVDVTTVTVIAIGSNNNRATCTFTVEVRPTCKYMVFIFIPVIKSNHRKLT